MTLTIHLKPDQIEALPEAMKGGVGAQNGHQALYIHPVYLNGVKIRC